MSIKQVIKNVWRKIVLHKYVSTGLFWGDVTSYTFLGKSLGYSSLCKKMDFWESQYEKLGYVPIDRERWVEAGGYGGEYESQLMRVKND